MTKQTTVFDTILSNKKFTPALRKQISDVMEEEQATALYVDKVIRGVYKHAILMGAAGLGKSYAVTNALNKANLTEGSDYKVIKGHLTALQLFKLLYLYRNPNQVLVLDDCDIEDNLVGIDLLKAATDADYKRVSWESSVIPVIAGSAVSDFTFKGSVIICSNSFGNLRKGSQRDNKLKALTSRIRPRKVNWETNEKKFAQIFNMVVNAGYLDTNPQTKLTVTQKEEMLTFILDNIDNFDALDLRLPQKIASDIVDSPKDWKQFCYLTLLK